MTAGLAREDLGQSILLILVAAFVQIEGDFPFALEHVTRRMDCKHGVEPIQIDFPEATLFDVPGD